MEQNIQRTGYPHIDNIHKGYYAKKGNEIDVNKTMFRYIEERVRNYDGIAISFYGHEITYKELLDNIIKYAKSFYDIGVRAGTRVTFLLPSMPEAYYMFYALSMLGAARNMVDLRTSINGITKYINETESEFLVCMDNYSPSKIKELLKNTTVKKIVTVSSPLETIKNPIKRTIGKSLIWIEGFGYKSIGEKIFTLDLFLKTGANVIEKSLESKYTPNTVTLFMHTSGTMKFPKTIMSTDEKQNFVASQYEKSLMDLEEKDRFLAIMPPWILYGIMGFHMPFSLKMSVFPIADPEHEKFDDLVLNLKPNHIAGVPNHYITLLESKKITPSTDLSFGKTYACGGAAINSEKQKEISEFLTQHGSKSVLNPGYSFSENTSVGSASQGPYVKLGSVGILLPDIEVMVIDQKTNEPLKYNEKGIICLRGALMNGYLNDEEETSKVIKTIDEREWAISGDIGYVDEDGFLFIEGREKNLIIGPDGFKIAPNEIESKICKHPSVKNCIVIGIQDKNHEYGDKPVAFIELKEKTKSRAQIKRIIKEIKQICESELSSYYRPDSFYVGEILYTAMMKDDKVGMKREFEEESSKKLVRKIFTGSKIYK